MGVDWGARPSTRTHRVARAWAARGRALAAVLVAAFVFLFTSGAHADERRIGVGGLAVEGELSEESQRTLREALDRGLSGREIEIVELEDHPTARCPRGDDACFAEVAAEAGVDLLVLASVVVEEDGRWFTLRLHVVDGATGKAGPRSEEPCKPCGLREVAEKFEAQAGALGDRLENLKLTPATIVIDTEPAGAAISIDGAAVGTSPVTVEVEPGSRALRAELDGHEPQATTIEAVRGVEEAWSPRLAPVPAPVVPRPDPEENGPTRPGRGLRIAGWTTLGVGIAAVAAGVPFIVLHERPYSATCDGRRDAEGLCPSRWRSLPQGAAFVAVGAALVVTAIPLLAVGYRKGRVGVSLSPSNMGVQWTGRF